MPTSRVRYTSTVTPSNDRDQLLSGQAGVVDQFYRSGGSR
jgi:hypothetical protein